MESFLKKIFDVFSNRNKQKLKTENNAKKIITIPMTFRNRVFKRCNEVFDNYMTTFIKEINRFLQYKTGSFKLSNYNDNNNFSRRNFLLEDTLTYINNCSGEDFIDFIEYIFRVECFFHINIPDDQFVDEINEFIKIDALPYYLTKFAKKTIKEKNYNYKSIITLSYPKVIMKENEFIHSQTMLPVLNFLQHPEYSNANNEFLEALEDYRKGDLGDCLTKCGSSFESVMKIICKRKGWHYDQKDTASKLIKIILDKTKLDSLFEQTLIITATLRNKLSKSHGSGTLTKNVPSHLAEYTINITASSILLVLKEVGEI